MKDNEITLEKFNKLRPIVVTNMYGTFKGYRLLRRNKRYTTCAFLFDNDTKILTVLYKNEHVTLL